MKPWILCTGLIVGAAALAQQPSDKPAFEVASIKPADPQPMGMMRVGMNTDAGMLRYTNVSLKDCIRTAYRVNDFQVEGPDWFESARFDIVAKLPAGSSEEQVPEMLQALLAERFKLALHRETKEHAIYALVVAKGGPKLKPAEVPTGGDDAPGANAGGGGTGRGPKLIPAEVPMGGDAVPGANTGRGGMGRGGVGRGGVMMQMDQAGMHLKASSTTLARLGEAISRFTERPIVDMTGVQGQYDFDLVFSPETMRGMRGGMPGRGPGPIPPPGGGANAPSEAPADAAGSIFDAVQRYGLKMEPRKAPMEILAVDHIEKTPTEN